RADRFDGIVDEVTGCVSVSQIGLDDAGRAATIVDDIAEVFGIIARTVAMDGDDEAVRRKIERDRPTYPSGRPSNQRTCTRLTHVSPVCLRHHIYGAWRRFHRPRRSQKIVLLTAQRAAVWVIHCAEKNHRAACFFVWSAS